MCEDFRRAADNREMVAKHQNIIGYLAVEAALKVIPVKSPLPSWIPTGTFEPINRKELKGQGFHEIEG